MSAREAILSRIGAALGRDDAAMDVAAVPAVVTERLASPRRHVLPSLPEDTLGVLIERMEAVLISVVRLQSRADVPEAVRFWLASEGVEGDVTVSPALDDVPFPDTWRRGAATGEEVASVTPCVAAIAETGSLALASGAGTPATLNFLPENHVIVLHESQVVRHVDDLFPILRAHSLLPRAVNLVTGPSRTADIEQTLEIGAHGPRRMHVLLLPGSPPTSPGTSDAAVDTVAVS